MEAFLVIDLERDILVLLVDFGRLGIDLDGYFAVVVGGLFLAADGHTPVEHVVPFVVFAVKEFLEHLSQVEVVGLVFEAQTPTVVEVGGKLDGERFAKDFYGGGHFFLHNFIVLFLLVIGLESLPR